VVVGETGAMGVSVAIAAEGAAVGGAGSGESSLVHAVSSAAIAATVSGRLLTRRR
jgi:hypothetical protein